MDIRDSQNTEYPRPTVDFDALNSGQLDLPIFIRFEWVADRYPEKIAVDDGTYRFRYRDIQQAVRHLARRVEAAVPAGRAVGIYLPNCALFSIAALACFATGRILVPIDQSYPPERNDQIIKEAGLAAVIVDGGGDMACRSLAGIHHLDITDSLNRVGESQIAFYPTDGPAIVLYTSGSTGLPKGICNNQGAILQRIVHFTKTCGLDANDSFILLSSPGTIAGIRDTFAALLNGATLFIADPYQLGMNGILAALRDHRVTICYAVPALLREILRLPSAKDAFANLRILRFGGDRVLASDIALCRDALPQSCRILVGFGSTEVPTIFQWFVPPGWTSEGAVPCGYMVSDIPLSLVTDQGTPAAPGEVGEVIVNSWYVALGLWRSGWLHSEMVQTDPDDPKSRIIHTADLVRLRDDGLVELIGRKDRQLKIRGIRIDPGDVEAALRRCDEVVDVAVAGHKLGTADILVAYVVARTPDADIRDRVRRAAQSLPTHMRPARIYMVAEIPRLPGFKPDITKLRNLEPLTAAKTVEDRWSERQSTAEREIRLLAICRQLLKTDNLGLSDNFFEAGGDSLSTMSLMLEIESQLGFEVSLDTIFENPVIGKLCAALDEFGEPKPAVILPVKTGAFRRALFFMHSGFEFSAVSNALKSDVTTAFVTINGTKWIRRLAAGDDVLTAIDRISRAYAEAIFAKHQFAPCYLAGHSFGGIIALETACKLEALGAAPEFVFLFDTFLHGAFHRIWYDIRYNGWLRKKLNEVVRGNLQEVARRTRFLSRNWLHQMTQSSMFEPIRDTEQDVATIFRDFREEASQIYAGPIKVPTSRVVLFRASKSDGRILHVDPDLGWARRLANFEVVMTPGSHTTLVSRENADYIAAEIGYRIDLCSKTEVSQPSRGS